MDERGYNSEDDFVNNEVEEADVRITAAIANMGNLRHFIRPAKKSKKNQKPGGHRTSVVRMMFYLLPDGSEIPKFTRRDPIIQTHQNHGFGYPATYYSNFSGKYHPMSVNLTEDEFREEIRSLYQRLGEKEFGLYTIGKDKKFTAAPFKPSYFKESKYQGRVIIKINENPDVQPAPSVDVNETASTEQQQLEPIPSPGQQEIVEIQPRFLESATQTMVSSFREEVTINPRHALILQQDLEYAESLLIDQNKDHQRMQASLRRSMAREERQRQRNLQKERQAKIQAEAIEEISFLRNYGNQDDLLTMIFVLPTGQQNRKISKKTPSETLHIYVEATFNVLSAKLLIGSKVITRTQQTIGDLGITANSRVIVEDLAIESEDSASEEDQDDIAIDDTLPYNPTHLNDITELNKRRVNIYEHLLPAKSITIRRTHLVQDVLDTYRLDKSLVHHHLQVTFEGEEKALDLEGVTREMFSTVIPQLMANYFTGRQEKVPANEISFLFDGTFEVIGHILAHAFVLVNYLATGLSSVILGLIGTGDCSNALLLSSFKKFVSEEESRLIEDALKLKAFDQNMLFQLINFFGSYQGTEVPKPSTLHHQLISLAKLQLCVIPLYAISKLKEGLSCYPILFNGITEDVIKELKEQYQPTGQKIIDQLYFVFTEDDIVLRSMEERVKGYLERFISNLSNTELSEMLRFWTSADTVCLDKLTVMFNSLEGLQRRPLANTCTATLQVSRLYLSATELSKEFKTFIMDPSSRVFDSI